MEAVLEAQNIIYEVHVACEQSHGEIKSHMDAEGLPSGKLLSNALVSALARLAYSILRHTIVRSG